MKTRRLLYLAIAAAILTLAIAAPALADDGDTLMWVERNRLAWTGRSSGGTDCIVAKIHIFDANNAMVTDASVSAVWTLPDGTNRVATSVTSFQGIAEFRIWTGRGDYMICVTDVVKPGWLYDSSLNRAGETCSTVRSTSN